MNIFLNSSVEMHDQTKCNLLFPFHLNGSYEQKIFDSRKVEI